MKVAAKIIGFGSKVRKMHIYYFLFNVFKCLYKYLLACISISVFLISLIFGGNLLKVQAPEKSAVRHRFTGKYSKITSPLSSFMHLVSD